MSRQTNMFESLALPEPADGDTVHRWEEKSHLLSILARNRALTKTLLEKVVLITNLNQACKQVKRNRGAPGVDGMKVTELESWLREHLQELKEKLLGETYVPQAVLGVTIPKPNGGTRLLGIPTTIDRLLQQAIHQQLSKYYEPIFSDYSYGFRPGRSALQAVAQASEYIGDGYEWVVDIDLASFFDRINHDRLMQRLSKGIGDKRLLRLIHSYLRAGIMQDGLTTQRISGTPQGGPLSPLLSNIVLDELDRELEKRGHRFCRYADDCNIYVKSRKSGERVLSSLVKFIEKRLKLQVNRDKSGLRHCSEVKFLGYTIMPGGKIRIAEKSIRRFKDKIRQITKRNRGLKYTEIIKQVNLAIQGWVNYFKLTNCWLPWRDLDCWIRRRLRCYRLKQCGRSYTIYKLLRRLGSKKSEAWNAVVYSQGWWHLSNKTVCNKTMNVCWFTNQGLLTLAGRYQWLNS